VAREAGVRLETAVTAAGAPSNREAEFVLLILENLMQNAIEATPPGKAVRLTIASQGERTTFEVEDEGPGLPREIAERLFTPCISTKKGGTGIGLAISRQLAAHLGAELELKHSSAQGTSFRLTLSPAAQKPEPELSGSASV
jgi:signal transduction histidine kinase